MLRASCFAAIAALAVTGCAPWLAPTLPMPPPAPEPLPDPETIALHRRTIERVVEMPQDPALVERVTRRGLSIVDLSWEDTARLQGSALGPNISDVTLQVRRRGAPAAPRAGEFPWAGGDTPHLPTALLPIIRPPNFGDRTGDVPRDRLFLRVGNHRREGLVSVPLAEVLGDLRRFATAPETLGGENVKAIDLRAERDTHYLLGAQAVFLPIPRTGKAEFNPVVFNYQSAPGSPAVLAILATREGSSVQVIENRPEDRSFRGMGQELYFNEGGQRAAFTAERRSEVAARIAAQGGPRSEADRSALGRGADVMLLIQVPLKHGHRGHLGGLPESGKSYGYEFSDDPLAAGGFGPNDATIRVRPGPVRSDLERAVLGHGPRLGPFFEGWGSALVRDPRFPVRVTVQFYKATSNGVVSEADLEGIARNIESAYMHADHVGSLVLPERDSARPTAWQKVPGEWFPW